MPRRRPARNRIEAALVWVLLKLLRPWPRRFRLGVGHLLGLCLYFVSTRLRAMALANLDRAFGESRSREEKIRIARGSFRHLGHLLCDIVAFQELNPEHLEEMAVFEGLDHLKRAHEQGKGVYLFTGHYGNWEMVALIHGYQGFPLAVVARPLDNPYLEKMLYGFRTMSGNEVIHKQGAAREILRAIRKGSGVAIVIDQNVRGEQGIFVDFFGSPASTTPALATLALKTESPIIPAFGVPLPDGRYRIRYLPPLEFERTGDTKADILNLTQKCTQVIEETIRAEPEFWVWMHRRWRTRPRTDSRAAATQEKVSV
jgi:KDO2-lipid IV(A) lauroyltransferase